jgi:succinate dehydrogenase / fumarate reductase, membrane anchor subunit
MRGLTRWLWQRFSAVFLLCYIVYLSFFILSHYEIMTFKLWSATMHQFSMSLATSLALFFLCVHSWIGCWTIATDYVKCSMIRLPLLSLYSLILMSSFLSGLVLLWR